MVQSTFFVVLGSLLQKQPYKNLELKSSTSGVILAKDTRDHTPHQSASYSFDTLNQNVDHLAQSGIEAKERVTFTDYVVEVSHFKQ